MNRGATQKLWGLLLLFASLAHIGCQTPYPIDLAPHASQLEAATSASHQEILPASFSQPAEQLPAPKPATELKLFDKPLTLADAVTIALRDNPRLREAKAQVDAARAGQQIAFAPFLPEIGTKTGFSAFNEQVIPGGAFVAASINGGAYAYNLAEAGIHWTLCDFGRREGHYGQAATQTRMAESYLRRAQQTIAFETSQAYLNLLFARATVRVREQALEQAQSILKDTKARLEGGVVDREAVLRADVEVSQAQEDLLAARQQVRDGQATLNLVLGQPTTQPVEVQDVTEQIPFDRTLQECLEKAVASRPEIAIGREAVAEARYGEEAARGELYPRIYVRGTVLRADSQGPVTGWLVGAGIHLEEKLYAGGSRTGEIHRSQAKVAGAGAGLQSILDSVGHEVNIAFQAIPTSQEQVRLGEITIKQARENLRLTVVRYNNGNATPTDVVDAQTVMIRAQTRYYAAVYHYLEGLARLEYTEGGDQSRLLAKLHQVEALEPILGKDAPARVK